MNNEEPGPNIQMTYICKQYPASQQPRDINDPRLTEHEGLYLSIDAGRTNTQRGKVVGGQSGRRSRLYNFR